MAEYEQFEQPNRGNFEFSAEDESYLKELDDNWQQALFQNEAVGQELFPVLFNRLMELDITHGKQHLFSKPKNEGWDRLLAFDTNLVTRKGQELYNGQRIVVNKITSNKAGDSIIETYDYSIDFTNASIVCVQGQINQTELDQREDRKLEPEEGPLIINKGGTARLAVGKTYQAESGGRSLKTDDYQSVRQLINQLREFNPSMRDELYEA